MRPLVFGTPDIEPIGALAETDPTAWARNVSVNLIGA